VISPKQSYEIKTIKMVLLKVMKEDEKSLIAKSEVEATTG
jgi:hypothetical protein